MNLIKEGLLDALQEHAVGMGLCLDRRGAKVVRMRLMCDHRPDWVEEQAVCVQEALRSLWIKEWCESTEEEKDAVEKRMWRKFGVSVAAQKRILKERGLLTRCPKGQCHAERNSC